MGFDPASTPSADGAISGAHDRGNLLIALLGMLMGRQNDPGTHGKRLWCGVRSDEVLKALGFFNSQCNGISRFGSSHMLSPPTPSLSSLVDFVKLGKHL
jgi:hypothetical protein